MRYAKWFWQMFMRLVVLIVVVLIDCTANWMHGGSIRHTLSAEAWNQRDHKYSKIHHKWIDAIFGKDHCKIAAEREKKFGSMWAAWVDKTKRVWNSI